MKLDNEVKKYIKKHYITKYPEDTFEIAFNGYLGISPFCPNENVHETHGHCDDEVHYVMRLCAQYYMINVFEAMKMDLSDPNLAEDTKNGNIGTPARIVKMWTGSDTNDNNELISGRWAKKPRLARFPNTHEDYFPITKRVDLTAVCSHHAAPFSTTFREDAYAIISYIPSSYVIGISKLQRLTDWVSQRAWLQEDLTKKIYEEVCKIADTKSVYVRLVNVVHTCESLRGAKSQDGSFTSEYYGGEYNKHKIRSGIVL